MSAARRDFEDLFGREFDRCTGVAHRIVLNEAIAQELAAEAFTRAWVRWRRISRFPSPGGWLVKVTTNLALDHVRRGGAPLVVTADRDALDDMIVVHEVLLEAVNRLPQRQRAAVSLRYFADLTVDGVAEAMGISAGAVKTHLHRGLGRLRELLDTEEHDLEVRLAPGT